MFERDQGAFAQPLEQQGMATARDVQNFLEPRTFAGFAEQRDRMVHAVQPRRPGERIGTQQAMSELALLQTDIRHGTQ